MKMDRDLSKLFESAEELLEPEEAIVEGELPEWLSGTFIRVGPGKWDLGNFTMNHFLDGYALLSKFEINGKSIKFQKKFLESDAYLKAMAAQKPQITEFGTKGYPNNSNKGLFSRIMSSITPPELTDNAACSIFQLPNRDLFVTSNTPFFRQICPETLSTGDKYDYSKCFGLNGVSVHPLTDEFGDQYQIGFSVMTGAKYNIVKIPGDEKYGTSDDLMRHSSTICSIPSRWNTSVGFFHSFGMSTNFIIFLEIPYLISLTKAAKSMIKGDTFKDWLEWRPEEPCKFFVIEKKSGKVRKVDYVVTKPFFFLHFVNCFEVDSQIVVDINCYDSPAVIERLDLKNLRCNALIEEKDPPSIRRFVLPLVPDRTSIIPCGVNLVSLPNSSATAIKERHQITLRSETLSLPGLELPTINPHYQGKRSKFVYAAGNICRNHFTNSICKVNTEDKNSILWRGTEADYPGEPLFIPQEDFPDTEVRGSAREDDGVLISACSNADIEREDGDFLLFLDPKNMRELGRATFKARIPQALHGFFLREMS